MINIAFYQRCIAALQRINEHTEDEPMYDIYRSICIKKFEIILEQSKELLKKYLVLYFAGRRQVDQLTFNDIFRYAGKHRLLSLDGTEIDCSILADCVETINESKIPILVELRDYYALPASFHSEINHCNQLLWESTQ